MSLVSEVNSGNSQEKTPYLYSAGIRASVCVCLKTVKRLCQGQFQPSPCCPLLVPAMPPHMLPPALGFPGAGAEAAVSWQQKLHIIDLNTSLNSFLSGPWRPQEGGGYLCKLESPFILCSFAAHRCQSLDELWQKILNTGPNLCVKQYLLQSLVTHCLLIGFFLLA